MASKRKPSKRSVAARKGWATRRANALRAKRSAAARKGVATRKRNAAKRARAAKAKAQRGYKAARRGREATGTAIEFKAEYTQGKSSAGVNVRLVKANGDRITEREARWAAEQFLKRRGVPSAYRLEAISWQSGKNVKRGEWTEGEASDLENLRPLLGVAQLDLTPGLVEEG